MTAKTIYEQALELEALGFYADALTLFNQCLDNPSYPRGDIFFHCGWCIEQQHGSDSEFACDLYEQSLETITHSSGKSHAAFRAGWIRFHRKEYAEASDMFRRAIKEGRGVEPAETIVHHAMYWLAVCLEAENRYLDAITWYRKVRDVSSSLEPEARLREIYCLVSVADFEAALQLARTFETDCPPHFPESRYSELARTAAKEKKMLEQSLAQGVLSLN